MGTKHRDLEDGFIIASRELNEETGLEFIPGANKFLVHVNLKPDTKFPLEYKYIHEMQWFLAHESQTTGELHSFTGRNPSFAENGAPGYRSLFDLIVNKNDGIFQNHLAAAIESFRWIIANDELIMERSMEEKEFANIMLSISSNFDVAISNSSRCTASFWEIQKGRKILEERGLRWW
jgi:hypothetical protein